MIRLFIAIDLPPAIRSLVHDLARDIPGTHPVPLNQLHLTLKFIGDVGNKAILSLTEALATVENPAFSLAFQGVGCFPPRGTPRIVWAGIAPQPELEQLHSLIDQTLEQQGFARETRQFSPHVTLARLKTPAREPLRLFLARHGSFGTEPFQIQDFRLYSSRLTSAGAIHNLEAVYELRK